MAIYIHQIDPNDGYDRVWAFADEKDANKFIELNKAYYEGSRYEGEALAKRMTDGDELVQYIDQIQAPVNAGALDEMELEEDVDDEAFRGEAFDLWIQDHEELHSCEYVHSEDDE